MHSLMWMQKAGNPVLSVIPGQVEKNNLLIDANLFQLCYILVKLYFQQLPLPGGQSANPSASPPASQSVTQLASQPVNQSACQPVNQSVSQSVSSLQVSQSVSQPVSLLVSSQSVSQSVVNQTVSQLVGSQSVSQSDSQLVSCQSVSQSVSHSVSQSVITQSDSQLVMQVRIPFRPELFSGSNFKTAYVVCITVMINHVFMTFFAVQIYDLSFAFFTFFVELRT